MPTSWYIRLCCPCCLLSLTRELQELLTQINDILRADYTIRREMLIKRVDVTLQSFLWSHRAEVSIGLRALDQRACSRLSMLSYHVACRDVREKSCPRFHTGGEGSHPPQLRYVQRMLSWPGLSWLRYFHNVLQINPRTVCAIPASKRCSLEPSQTEEGE
jgi:hypothetical protein